MTVEPEDVYRSSPDGLAKILRLPESYEGLFSPEELAAVLRHQLGALLLTDLLPETDDAAALDGQAAAAPAIRTWADLLFAPAAPLELLVEAKRFAKASPTHPDRPLPPEIADCLYYAAVSAALVRHDQRITTLTSGDLQQGLRTLLARPWLPAELREHFENALRKVESQP